MMILGTITAKYYFMSDLKILDLGNNVLTYGFQGVFDVIQFRNLLTRPPRWIGFYSIFFMKVILKSTDNVTKHNLSKDVKLFVYVLVRTLVKCCRLRKCLQTVNSNNNGSVIHISEPYKFMAKHAGLKLCKNYTLFYISPALQ